MRIFVTGATGYIGSAIVDELLQAGHEVLGLARSDVSATTLARASVEVHRGVLDDLDGLRAGAAGADGVIFAANPHISETTDPAARAQVELNAVEAIGSELEKTDKPFVVTSGVIGRTPRRLLVEGTPAVPNTLTALRLPVEQSVLAMGERGVRSSSVRLAPTVQGQGDTKGFISSLIGIARGSGVSAYVGDGLNRWPAVHRGDAATLFRLAVESAPPGTPVHAVAEEGVPFRDIAEAIGRRLELPAVSLAAEEAGRHFGLLAPLVSIDSPTSSALTRALRLAARTPRADRGHRGRPLLQGPGVRFPPRSVDPAHQAVGGGPGGERGPEDQVGPRRLTRGDVGGFFSR